MIRDIEMLTMVCTAFYMNEFTRAITLCKFSRVI